MTDNTGMAHPCSRSLFAPADERSPARLYVIAELGVNHDGQVERALELVTAAAGAGADAVKLQVFDPRQLLSNQATLARYQESVATDVVAMLDQLRLSEQAMAKVRNAARQAGLGFVLTFFSIEDLPTLGRLDPDAVKIASPDAVNEPLLRAAATLGKPLLVSTGTCDLDELTFAADLLAGHGPGGCLLQCVSSYPTPTTDAALGGIAVLRERFGLAVGYSDHTPAEHTGSLAVAAGACVVEKHLTWSRSASGPDHAASLEPGAFARYVAALREAGLMLGPRCKRLLPIEADVRRVSRQSLCARRDLAVGRVLSSDDVTIRRPGTGIPAAALDRTLGRRLARAVPAGQLITPADLAA